MKFGVVGIVNTALGFAITMTLQVGLGVAAQASNACGYAVGFVASFTLNRAFVFPTTANVARSATRFCAAGAAAFAFNQAVLSVTSHVFDRDVVGVTLAQGIAMATYTATFFVLCRTWVFRTAPARATG